MERSALRSPGSEREAARAKRIAFVHHKGGTGKTTACLNIAGWLAKMKHRVLVVDLDPQGNATAGLGIDRAAENGSTMSEVLFGSSNLRDSILETDCGVFLAPSSLDLLAAETRLSGQASQMHLLREHLSAIERDFDYVLLDLPPGSTRLMISGLVAAEEIIIPLDCGVFAYETLETLKVLIRDLQEELGVELDLSMVLLRRSAASHDEETLTREIQGLVGRFLDAAGTNGVKTYLVPFSLAVHRAQMGGLPISHYAPASAVGRTYRKIAKAMVNSE